MAPSPKSDLVVLISPGPDLPGWMGVLQDWSAMGLVRDFIVINADIAATTGTTPCLTVSAGVARSAALQHELAGRHLVSGVQVVCLSRVDSDLSTVGFGRAGRLRQEVRDTLPAARLTWVHAISVTVPDEWPRLAADELAWTGAHNVVLAPENAQSPFSGVAQVTSAEKNRPVGLTHRAAALCSAAGLWEAESRAVFGGDPDGGGGQVVALRTYTRHLSREGILSRVLAHLADMRTRYPVPHNEEGRSVQLVNDEVQATEQMVTNLIARHDELRRSRRVTPSNPARKDLGLFQALKMFLRFFAGVLRGAPKAFLYSLQEQVAKRIAAKAQNVLFGGDRSSFRLTVNGIAGIQDDGTIADPDEVDAKLASLLAQVRNEPGAAAGERQEFPALWKDYVSGAFTLLDGLPRVEGMPAARVGAVEAVVGNPMAVAPDPRVPFDVPLHAQSVVKASTIAPYDDDLARILYTGLKSKAEGGPGSGVSESTLVDIKEWFRTPAASYVGSLGRRLSTEIREAREEVVSGAAELADVGDPLDLPEELETLQRSLANTILIHAGIFLGLIALTLFGGWAQIMSWTNAAVVSVTLVLVWLVSASAIFVKRQHKVFHLLHEREMAMARATAVKQNLECALIDVRRLQSIYRQYLDWSQALGVFLQEPWGRGNAQDESESRLGEGFGLNHRFGNVVADEEGVEDEARRLQGRLFPVGWLTEAWDEFLTDRPNFTDRPVLEGEPELIFTDRPVTEVSVLHQWSEAVAAQPRMDVADKLRDRLVEQINGVGSTSASQLIRHVRWQDTAGVETARPHEEFIVGLAEISTGAVQGRSFSRAIFADVPDANDPWKVEQALGSDHTDRTATTLVVTELSASFSPRDLAFGPSSDAGVSHHDTPPGNPAPSTEAPQV
ncbi:hypothetical protein ncot_11815 [Nocardioides sp. JQ2195]|uniref:hypothetical protein n=1 Tax=Nocardioides sp. JQ2195 TaxID=2592334 RepID=UPI00143EC428|nr:hypothetical protein [Nocardioides sp. JQ2195]QIX27209.1 hypothetical protein ncot_11815 [Nocardioides sp. JQ2195]